jgi:hypothetical protein
MKAYEFPVKVTPEGKLDIPPALTEVLPRGQVVRILLLISEPADADEQTAWVCLTAEQFLAGYSEADAIYDRLS